MKQEMSRKQKRWLAAIACLGVLAASGQLLFVPGAAHLRDVMEQRDQARKAQQDMNIAVMTVAAVAQDIQDNYKKRTELARPYYALSQPQRLDQELLQLAKEQGLLVQTIEIKGPEPGGIEEYLPSLSPEQQEEWAQSQEEEGQFWSELRPQPTPQPEEEPEPPEQAFVYTQQLTLTAAGSQRAWVDFLDAVAKNPALHLTDLQQQSRRAPAGKEPEEQLSVAMSCRFLVVLTAGEQAP